MFSLLFHKDCFFPQDAQKMAQDMQKKFTKWTLSQHVLDHANDPQKDKSHRYTLDGLQESLKQVLESPHEVFELELSKDYYKFGPGWFITKICIRVPYGPHQDACLSIRPNYNKETKEYEMDNAFIVTCWLNCDNDSHTTLDESKYCSQQKWREEH